MSVKHISDISKAKKKKIKKISYCKKVLHTKKYYFYSDIYNYMTTLSYQF